MLCIDHFINLMNKLYTVMNAQPSEGTSGSNILAAGSRDQA